MSNPGKYTIIVAGGSGQRMGSKIPKQFLLIKGRPILMYTIEAFHQYLPVMPLTLVLPSQHIEAWKGLCSNYKFNLPVTLCAGGRSRFQSVKNGLATLPEKGLVAIHDGVRPLVDTETIERSFISASQYQSGVTTIPVKNSIREVFAGGSSGSKSLDRSNYRMVQTPQTFDLAMLKKAYDTEEQTVFTDDASVWESAGNQVNLVEGSENNLKITTVQDLVIAEMLLNFK